MPIVNADERAALELELEEMRRQYPGQECYIDFDGSVGEAVAPAERRAEPEDPLDAYPKATRKDLEAIQDAVDRGERQEGLLEGP